MSVFVKRNAMSCSFANSESWVILSPIEQSIKRKIEERGIPLKDWGVNIYRGILTGCNEAFIIDETKRQEILANCLNAAERERTDQLIRPILRGRDVKRYGYNWAGLYLIAAHNGYGTTPRINIDDYPAIKRHLDKYWNEISERSDKGDTPYNLRNCAYMDDFAKPKIVWADLARTGNAFIYDDAGFIMPNTTYLIASENSTMLKYLIGVLNSKAILRYLDWISAKLDKTGWRWFKEYVETFPIPRASQEDCLSIVSLVNQVVKSRAADLTADTFVLESKIDEFVYRLYGLAQEEIAVMQKPCVRL